MFVRNWQSLMSHSDPAWQGPSTYLWSERWGKRSQEVVLSSGIESDDNTPGSELTWSLIYCIIFSEWFPGSLSELLQILCWYALLNHLGKKKNPNKTKAKTQKPNKQTKINTRDISSKEWTTAPHHREGEKHHREGHGSHYFLNSIPPWPKRKFSLWARTTFL